MTLPRNILGSDDPFGRVRHSRVLPAYSARFPRNRPRSWGDELPRRPRAARFPLRYSDRRAAGAPAGPAASRPPSEVKAIYVNAWAFGGKRFYDLVRLADQTEVNAFVIDVKDDTGYLTYRSEVPTAIEIGANTQRRAPRRAEAASGAPRTRHPSHRPHRRGQGSAAGIAEAGLVGPARERRPLARPPRLRLGGRLQRLGLGLRLAARRRGRPDRLRRGAVRLRAVPRRAGVPAGSRGFSRTPRGRDETPGRGSQPQAAR